MKKLLFAICVMGSFTAIAQSPQKGWFVQRGNTRVYLPPPPDAPSVPLDGGLSLLLAAGGAAGYRKYKQK